ncbi:MAG: DNA recombination protein RmuC [Chloroflexi bacterium]|nr:MAG: DNA recombination protein RmuC [Chloroflexota bacterium]TMG71959.1 MAG: DNA recombination protein RmuC [Chloroflexota bacterium]
MEPIVLVAVAALAVAAVAVAIALRRPIPESGAMVAASVSAQVQAAQQGIQGNVQLLATTIEDLRSEVHRSLGAAEQNLATQATSTQRTLTELSRQLGTLGEQSQRIGDLAKDIGSLQDLLRAPKARGGFGELLLERLLHDVLPDSAYEIQYTYRDGSRVDAIVRYAGRIVPIDAKFPNESWTALVGAGDDAARRAKRRAFLAQVRRHIDAVAKYVSPADGTIDFALMYVPSEAVFYDIVLREDEGEPDLAAYCAGRHVIPASPNTLLAYLQVIALGVRGLAMQERTRELQQGIAAVRREFERFVELHDQLGRHLDNATKKFDETDRALSRASGAIETLAQAPIAAGGEQVALPLRVEREPER